MTSDQGIALANPARKLKRGSIVWVTTADPKGQNLKKRPMVLLSETKNIVPGKELKGAAISTTFPTPLPATCVALPWDPTGRAATGLRKPSVAVCDWIVMAAYEDVEPTMNYVPGNVLQRILDRIVSIEAR